MNGILFGLFLIAIVIVIHWAWRNDATPPDKLTGWLRMTVPAARKDAANRPGENEKGAVGTRRAGRPGKTNPTPLG
jgi:hypothetical protein